MSQWLFVRDPYTDLNLLLIRESSEHIQLFRERFSEKVHATIPKGIVGGFGFTVLQRNLKELARKAMKMCLRVLTESNKSRFDGHRRQEQCIDHIPYYLSGLSRAHFFLTTFLEIAEYAQYSYLFMAVSVRSAGICYSYGTLFTDLLRSVFSSYVFYRLNLVLVFVSFVAHVIV